MLLATASQCESPSLSRTFCKQTLCEQFWIVKTLINLFLRITSDAEKTPIFVHFEGFKLPLQIRYNYLVAPGRRRVAPRSRSARHCSYPFPSTSHCIASAAHPAMKNGCLLYT